VVDPAHPRHVAQVARVDTIQDCHSHPPPVFVGVGSALMVGVDAAGRDEGYSGRELNAWDIAAGIILVREAGGLVSAVREGDDPLEKGAVICGNEALFSGFRKIIRGE
jgi:fructose-1,6-bisphosphatase/inositol monophosphatase family enzyme